MTKHFAGRKALAEQFANAFLKQYVQFDLVGLDDASFRRYFRVIDLQGHSYILMDAPPELESSGHFVQMAALFLKQGLPVPEIFAANNEKGLVLMQDFGDRWLYDKLSTTARRVMPKALNLLQDWQQQNLTLQNALIDYTREKMLDEMALLQEWFLPFIDAKYYSKTLSQTLAKEQQVLVDHILLQPNVCVHRDFHSRNLMWLANQTIGIIDFQDAVWGPASYDLVSITRDCYIKYEASDVRRWEQGFGETNFPQIAGADWLNFCELTALQRHSKVLGLFVRLAKNAGKVRYLQDLPLVLDYSLNEARSIHHSTFDLTATLECLEYAYERLPASIEGLQ